MKMDGDVKKEEVTQDKKSEVIADAEIKNPELSKIVIVTPEQIDAKLAKLRGRLPSLLLNKLAESLKMTRVTEAQCDEIIARTIAQFERSGNASDIMEISKKLENLDNSILSLVQFLERAYGAGNNIPSSTPRKEEIESRDAKVMPVKERQEARLAYIDNKIENIIVLLKWIEFLMERVGRENLARTLEFYVDIEWINDDVMNKILTYARGVNVSQEETEHGYVSELSVKDHIQSLLFIEKLRGCEVDKQLISFLEKEIMAIKKGSEDIYGI
jgi:archaellum component FlaD/FlaE